MSAALGADPVADRLNRIGPEFGGAFAAGQVGTAAVRAALARLGDPQDALPPVIHVAGTNGKGSVCAVLAAIAAAAGLRAHVFTKPHLHRTTERLRLAGREVDATPFLAAIDRAAAAGPDLSHFETQVVAALLLAAETPAELMVLEVGCGGRDDATNVLRRPAVAVLTPIDFDHVALLGPTLAHIAAHKAGILKRRAPAVSARQAPEAEAAIRAAAADVVAAVAFAGQDWDAHGAHGRLVVETQDRLLDLPAPSLVGAHQLDNAGLAVRAMLALDHPAVTEAALAAGVAGARWPGRLQRRAHPDLELWVDGGHNAHAARALAHWLAGRAGPTTLIVGQLAGRDPAEFLAPFAGGAVRVAAVEVPPPFAPRPSLPAAAICDAARALGLAADTAPDLPTALTRAADSGPRALITGSLALAAAALA